MQPIQWFPGHMTKALRMMEDNVRLCDGFVYVLDARAVFGCINFKLDELLRGKPTLYLINKADTVEDADIQRITAHLKAEGKRVISTVGTTLKDGKAVYNAIIDMFSEKLEAKKAKGITKTLRVMVCGVPNTGKSTIINSLAGRKQAVTGNKAGVTKGKQWIKLGYVELLDTPGTMPPSFENQTYAHHLAYIGSINDAILDAESLALDLLEELSSTANDAIKKRYGVEPREKPIDTFDAICSARGFILKGGEYDYERCAKAVIDDFRKQRLGKICLETRPIN